MTHSRNWNSSRTKLKQFVFEYLFFIRCLQLHFLTISYRLYLQMCCKECCTSMWEKCQEWNRMVSGITSLEHWIFSRCSFIFNLNISFKYNQCKATWFIHARGMGPYYSRVLIIEFSFYSIEKNVVLWQAREFIHNDWRVQVKTTSNTTTPITINNKKNFSFSLTTQNL